MKAVLEILQLLSKYDPDGEVDAEHDELYVSGDFAPDKLGPADVRRLEQLGCRWDEGYGSWRKFV
jgi:hypothetical protein